MKSVLKNCINVKNAKIKNIEFGSISVPSYDVDENGNITKTMFDVEALFITLTPDQQDINKCPVCGRECSVFDRKDSLKSWRAPDIGNKRCYYIGPNHRIDCPEHGHKTVAVEWADSNSRFTRDFDLNVAYMYKNMSKSAISQLLGIDWETTGKCISRAKKWIDPNPEARLNNLVNIGVDETSYKKGHSYITVVVNHDTGDVVWAAPNHGEKVFSEFFETLTPEQRASIKTVTGDGARWIDACIGKYCPQAERCVDLFHVVGWITEALNDFRKEQVQESYRELKKMQEELKHSGTMDTKKEFLAKVQACRYLKKEAVALWKSQIRYVKELDALIRQKKQKKKGSHNPEEREQLKNELAMLSVARQDALKEKAELNANRKDCQRIFDMMIRKYQEQYKEALKEKELILLEKSGTKDKVSALKGCMYSLLKNPDNLTSNQAEILELIQLEHPGLFHAYKLKEQMRTILHFTDPAAAKTALEACLTDFERSGIDKFIELAGKIRRHEQNILNTLRIGLSNARLEATNNKIKLIIRRSYGFRNIDNMLDTILLYCSNMPILLPNHPISRQDAEKLARIRKNRKAV